MQSQTALVASRSLTLSPVHIMTISVINFMTGCRLYDLKLFMSPTNRSGELLSENPIRMQGIYQIFDVAHSWLRDLVKNNEEPQVLEERWMLHASRSIDEAKRLASQLQSSSLAAVFGLGQA